MTKYIVETISSFYEVHIVEAENEDMAKKVASEADWNTSQWIGQQVIDIRESSDAEINRFKVKDPYFFNGYSTINKDGYLTYFHPDGTFNDAMKQVKIT